MSSGIAFPGTGSSTYRVNIAGIEQGPYPVEHVRALARTGQLAPTDAVSYAGQAWVPATSAPGIFSDKSYIAALLISFFLGALGIDRFYLGYIGLGVAKLFLGWLTFGIWPLIDFILIAVRQVPDAHGRPLR
nr:TM2 domain-containing protein [Arsenicicoccus piscis]